MAILVYVYRTLRRKKALRHGAAARSSPLKAKWVGPGQVLATEGSVVWINMLGELWRAAIEPSAGRPHQKRSLASKSSLKSVRRCKNV